MSGPVSFSWIARATLLVAGVLLLIWLAWTLSNVLLLIFGAVVVASILLAAAGFIERWTPLDHRFALALAGLGIALVIGLFLYLLGSQIAAQFWNLTRELPQAIEALGKRFNIDLVQSLQDAAESGWLRSLAGYAPDVAGAVASLIVVLVGGVFLAAQPSVYREGVLKLLPESHRDQLRTAFTTAGNALRLWLTGKLIAMLAIGVLTYLGLLVIGVPSALALAVIAGLLDFIPFLGPIIAFVPAGLVALSDDGGSFWWVLGLYLLLQQLENNLLEPLIQQRTVKLPPALGLFAIVALGSVFGPLGVILGIPLTVVLMVLVKQLYIRDTLGDRTHIPGENPTGT